MDLFYEHIIYKIGAELISYISLFNNLRMG